jgi:hypothetical protein
VLGERQAGHPGSSAYGVKLEGAGDVTISHSTINAVSDSKNAYGVFNSGSQSGSRLTIADSTINASNISSSGETNVIAVGNYSNNAGDLLITNSTLNATGVNSFVAGLDNESNTGSTTIESSNVNVASAAGVSYGVYNYNNTGALNITDSAFNISVHETTGPNAFGIFNDASPMNASNNTIAFTVADGIIAAGISGTNSGSGNTCKLNGVAVACEAAA